MNAPIRIKSFRAKNLTEALRMVRAELGPDATILETKPATRSKLGWSRNGVEVTASSGGHATSASIPPSEDPPSAHESTGDQQEQIQDTPVAIANHPTWNREEGESYPDVYMQVASQLLVSDVPTPIVERWLRQSLEQLGPTVRDAWLLRAHIARLIRSDIPTDKPTSSWLMRKQVVAVIGPSGHGKSSAAAKLAGLASMQLGLKPLVLSCESALTPSHTRIADYCSLMGWDFEPIDAPKLGQGWSGPFDDWDWVVFDMPSLPIGDREAMEQMQCWLTQLGATQVHLTLAATIGELHARRALDWYQGLQPSHLLLTKLDESFGVGSLVPFLASAHLPLGFVSVGPQVPSDILECDPARLAHWILGSDPIAQHELV